MSTTIQDLRHELHNKMLAVRAIDRIVATEDFEGVFKCASAEDQCSIINLIRQANRDGVEFWIRGQHQNEDGAKTIRELRIIGQNLGIRFYNRLPKALLLSEITKCRGVLTVSRNCESIAAN